MEFRIRYNLFFNPIGAVILFFIAIKGISEFCDFYDDLNSQGVSYYQYFGLLLFLTLFIYLIVNMLDRVNEKEIIVKTGDRTMTVTRTYLFGKKDKTVGFSYDDIAKISCETVHSRRFVSLKKYYIDLKPDKKIDYSILFDLPVLLRNLMTGNKCAISFYRGRNLQLDAFMDKLKAELNGDDISPFSPFNADDFKAQFRAAADPQFDNKKFKTKFYASAAMQPSSDSFKTEKPQFGMAYRPQEQTEKKGHRFIRNFLSLQAVYIPVFLFLGIISYLSGDWPEFSTAFLTVLIIFLFASVIFAIIKTIAQIKGKIE